MRRSNMFWGFVIIVVGGLLLFKQLFPHLAVGQFIWPTIIILIGVWLLIRPIVYRRNLEEEHVVIPIEDANEARIVLQHGAGKLSVGGMVRSGDLLDGTFYGGVVTDIRRQEDKVRVTLKAPSDIFIGQMPIAEGITWDLDLSQDIPLKLEVKGGANEMDLDLSTLNVSDILLSTGASSTQVYLPASAGMTRVKTESGAASVVLIVPQGVAARIHAHGALSSMNIDQNRFPSAGGFYQSADYDTAVNKIEIAIETGVGSVEVK